jgi:hypothetical protein
MQWRWKEIGIECILMTILLTNCGSMLSRPHTYRAAVLMALDDRAIPYRDVQVHDGCPPAPSDCFAISVIVVLAASSAAGWIACREYHEDCALWLPDLGLRRVPLPPLARDPPWLVSIRHAIWQIQSAVRTVR